MVFMTDGANTRAPNSPRHDNDARSNATHRATANRLTGEPCTNAKSAGIDVYTVAFSVSDSEIRNVLLGCASDASKFMDAATEAQLEKVFRDIGYRIRELHLSY